MSYTLFFKDVFGFFFVFARLGGVMMLLPGIGEIYVSPRIRLIFAFMLTLILAPLINTPIPEMPLVSFKTLLFIMQECFVGFFLGSLMRIFLNALQITSAIIGLQTSLSSAAMFNPALGTQDSTISSLFILGATAMIFVTDTHYIMLKALLQSYDIIPLFGTIPIREISTRIIDIVSQSFVLGVKLAFPIIIVSTVMTISAGLLNRLMPQLQVFFMIMPLQILGGFLVILMTIGIIMNYFIEEFGRVLGVS